MQGVRFNIGDRLRVSIEADHHGRLPEFFYNKIVLVVVGKKNTRGFEGRQLLQLRTSKSTTPLEDWYDSMNFVPEAVAEDDD